MGKSAGKLAVSIVLVALLGGCNHSGKAYTMRFKSQTDSKVLELTFPNTGRLHRAHNSVFPGGQPKGTYSITNGAKTVEGRAKQDTIGYLLYSAEGETQRLTVTDEGALKDEKGTLWKPENPAGEPAMLEKILKG